MSKVKSVQPVQTTVIGGREIVTLINLTTKNEFTANGNTFNRSFRKSTLPPYGTATEETAKYEVKKNKA